MDDLICGGDCAKFSLENCINMQPEGHGNVIGICKAVTNNNIPCMYRCPKKQVRSIT